jgi:DNA repair protein RadA/Sms
VQNGEERLREAAKHGFKHALAPAKNVAKGIHPGLEIVPVRSLREAIAAL